jgi:hypothetical protein
MFLNIYNSYLIFFKDKSINDCEYVASKIRDEITLCELEEGSLYADIEVSEIDRSDTLPIFIKKLIKQQNNPVSLDSKKERDILSILKDIFMNQDKLVGIQNFYRGVSLYRQIRISNITKEGVLIFKTSPARAMILKNDKFTYIRHPDLERVVKADILNVDVKSGSVYINKFEFMKSSAVDRKFIRVEPKHKTKAKLFINKKEYAITEILNLSVKSLAIKIKEYKKQDFLSNDLKIKFMIPDMNLKKVNSIVLDLDFFSSDGEKVIFLLRLNRFNRVRVLEYIGARQKELIDELKESLS